MHAADGGMTLRPHPEVPLMQGTPTLCYNSKIKCCSASAGSVKLTCMSIAVHATPNWLSVAKDTQERYSMSVDRLLPLSQGNVTVERAALAKHLVQEARRLFPAIEFAFDTDIEVGSSRLNSQTVACFLGRVTLHIALHSYAHAACCSTSTWGLHVFTSAPAWPAGLRPSQAHHQPAVPERQRQWQRRRPSAAALRPADWGGRRWLEGTSMTTVLLCHSCLYNALLQAACSSISVLLLFEMGNRGKAFLIGL